METLVRQWHKGAWWVWLLSPLVLLFWSVSHIRRLAYLFGIKQSTRVNASVIIVGNISVGGNGKTPVVLALAQYFSHKGKRVGILSRGYGGKSDTYPRQVLETDSPEEVGDEPRLLAIRSGVPVVVDPLRARGARFLCDELHCDIIICDDGLQHYALARDIELVVMDERLIGSGFLMPMGPLREGRWRLATVDAIIHNRQNNTQPHLASGTTPQFMMALEAEQPTSVKNNVKRTELTYFQGKRVTALAGIGAPERFFSQLTGLGVHLDKTCPYPDHYQFSPEDIPSGTVLMTEKDAVKVAGFAHDDCWFLPVTAKIDDAVFTLIENKLNTAHRT